MAVMVCMFPFYYEYIRDDNRYAKVKGTVSKVIAGVFGGISRVYESLWSVKVVGEAKVREVI